MPFIPLGLKETIEIDFMEAFSNRVNVRCECVRLAGNAEFPSKLLLLIYQFGSQIKIHYHEDPDEYMEAIQNISNTRQAARTPTRDLPGVNLLFRYYNLLYYVERRFFPYGKLSRPPPHSHSSLAYFNFTKNKCLLHVQHQLVSFRTERGVL